MTKPSGPVAFRGGVAACHVRTPGGQPALISPDISALSATASPVSGHRGHYALTLTCEDCQKKVWHAACRNSFRHIHGSTQGHTLHMHSPTLSHLARSTPSHAPLQSASHFGVRELYLGSPLPGWRAGRRCLLRQHAPPQRAYVGTSAHPTTHVPSAHLLARGAASHGLCDFW